MKKVETGLVLVRDTKFDKIRRKIMMFFYGKDYKMMEMYGELMKVNRPSNVIIPKPTNLTFHGKRNIMEEDEL